MANQRDALEAVLAENAGGSTDYTAHPLPLLLQQMVLAERTHGAEH